MNVTAPLLLLVLTASMGSGTQLPKTIWQFWEMIRCAQPGVSPLAYVDYGCWCGLRASGPTVDEVDKCCQVHDKCYEKCEKIPGCTGLSELPFMQVYDFTCSNEQVACSATNDKCQAAACECDRVAAHCFAQATYNPEYKNMDPKVHCVD